MDAVEATGAAAGGDPADPLLDGAASLITVDLDALARNYRRLRSLSAPATVAGVVKADAYGLGLEAVAPVLWNENCRDFFVATPGEAERLRRILPDATIFVLGGLHDAPAAFATLGLVPVLNSMDEVETWRRFARAARRDRAPAALHVDTGMNRLGLDPEDAARIARDDLAGAPGTVVLVMSHLACAESPGDPANPAQRDLFRRVAALFPRARASLANSGGVFLGAGYAFDLTRPGIALYGGDPAGKGAAGRELGARSGEMLPVVRWHGRILQVRAVDAGAGIGYGATFRAPGPMRIATVGVGYADGYPRALSNRSYATIGGRRAPLVGRVSMDLLTLDITGLPPDACRVGAMAELIGPGRDIDALASDAGTIAYEVLTGLSRRGSWVYRPPAGG